MNKRILDTDVQQFIDEHLHDDITKIILKKSPFQDVSSKELAEQIDSKKRCESKLPLWFNTKGVYFPPKLSIEQSTSEIAAKYKSNLIKNGELIDLTGGFGVDSLFFAKKAHKVIHCELNQELSQISKYNSKVFGVEIIYINEDAIKLLKSSNKKYDTIYIDPSRRIENKKVFLLKDCEPNIIEHLGLLKERSNQIIIKTAPLLDIQSGINELIEVSEIHIVSIKNECKELLFIINSDDKGLDPLISCAILGDKEMSFKFKLSEEKSYTIPSYSDPLEYIYEPDAALLKAGCFKLICRDFNIFKLHQHTHLYTSDKLKENFPGRKFRLKKVCDFGKFSKENQINQANIICRNFGLSPEELKKKLKIKDGGNEYLLFCTGKNNQLLVLNCERI